MKHLKAYNESKSDIHQTIKDMLIDFEDEGYYINIGEDSEGILITISVNIDRLRPDKFKKFTISKDMVSCISRAIKYCKSIGYSYSIIEVTGDGYDNLIPAVILHVNKLVTKYHAREVDWEVPKILIGIRK